MEDTKPFEKVRRGYRACLHCRSRKAKCDLGDIDAPSSPPCSRCRRESRECVFAPSRRGGNNRNRSHFEYATSTVSPGDSRDGRDGGDEPLRKPSLRTMDPPTSPSVDYNAGPVRPGYPGLSLGEDIDYMYPPSSHQGRSSSGRMSIYPPPRASTELSSNYGMDRGIGRSTSTYDSVPILPQHPPTQRWSELESDAPSSPKRRRTHLNPPLHAADPSSIVVADMHNESDALNILALATGHQESREGSIGERETSVTSAAHQQHRMLKPLRSLTDVAGLENFPLVNLGVVSQTEAADLTQRFFKFHHHLFPMVPSSRIPRTDQDLAVFARDERYLLTAMIIIASRVAEGKRNVHEKAWTVMRGWIADIQCLGAPMTIGMVESLLLLAENLPRDPSKDMDSGKGDMRAIGLGDESHGKENNQAWMLIGMAIRGAYGLGLDKLSMKLFDEAERTFDLERARLAWTYCYLFDRHVSLRLGKAFWSRGPAVCFQGYSSSNQTGPAAGPSNFPMFREIVSDGDDGDSQDDLANLVQAYVELTQMMSSAHDVLYPNPARTKSLVVYGEYFKYIDELMRSLDGFKVLWGKKKWKTFPLNDAIWAMFYYAQLYICAFSYQAHVERAAMRAEEEYQHILQQHKAKGLTTEAPRPALSLFPRGAAHSPDARYIFQSCDAARALLRICVDSLHPGGALPFLPSRFLLWFTYAAILLLKAVYSGAVLRADQPDTIKLIDRLCTCFSESSSEDSDPAGRYSRQLYSLKKRLTSLSDISRAGSPAPGHKSLHGSNLSSGQPNKVESPQSWSQAEDLHLDLTLPDQSGQSSSQNPFEVQNNMAPPHEQPMSSAFDIFGTDSTNSNLGFATLDDWFGQNTTAKADNTGNNVFGGLDLQDFWMNIGPSEAQGGFPFR